MTKVSWNSNLGRKGISHEYRDKNSNRKKVGIAYRWQSLFKFVYNTLN